MKVILMSICFSLVASFGFANPCFEVVKGQLRTSVDPSTVQKVCMETPKVVKCAIALAKEFPSYITLDQAVMACKQYNPASLKCMVHLAQEFPSHVPFKEAARVCSTYTSEKIECAIKLAVDFPSYVPLNKALETCSSRRQ